MQGHTCELRWAVLGDEMENTNPEKGVLCLLKRNSCRIETRGARQGPGPGTPGGNRVFHEIPVLLAKPKPVPVSGIFSLPLL